jgi:lipopolysaccharide transport system ATP-binding protein
MSNIAIHVDHLSKLYRLGAGPYGRGDFRDVAGAGLRRLLRRHADTPAGDSVSDLWALRDVSFEVDKGEVVGIIGHNGAGKSTLLKILSRITDPTSGHAWFEDRLGSLLEVGTGFHPELSGRENIYLSGALLGMSKREIAAKFDAIVDFAQIGRFLDTPVKRYSSGMYVRLGFAVAAHLDPEILIVDEVLAVGDAAFQRKCVAQMKDASRQGRTILFVSHNMGSMQTLCDRVIVLNGGRVIGDTTPAEAVRLYLTTTTTPETTHLAERDDRRGRGRSRLVDARVVSDGHEDMPGLLIYGADARIEFEVSEVVPDLVCSFTIYSQSNGTACRFASSLSAPSDRAHSSPRFVCVVPELSLVPGHYRITAALLAGGVLEDNIENAITFDVEYGTLDSRPLVPFQRSGVFVPKHRWIVPGRVQ